MIEGIVLIFLSVGLLILVYLLEQEARYTVIVTMIGTFSLSLGITLYVNNPTALDVYRGNTRIKHSIEVVNGDTIYSDSTVVWK